MFKLLRYFSITSLVAFITVTVLLATFYYKIAIKDLIILAENNNIALTRVFANSLWPQFAPFVTSATGLSSDELRAHHKVAELQEAVLAQMKGLSVVKVKVYNLEGLTVFSTDPSQIGGDKSTNNGYIAARAGQVASELTHRDKFSAFEQVIEDRDVLSSYIPIQLDTSDQSVEGVFELYTDLTPLIQKIKHKQRNVIVDVTLVLTLLYAILFLIVGRADRIIKRQYMESRRSKGLLTQSEERYMLAARGANDGLWDWNVKTNNIYFSDRWKAMLGYSESDFSLGRFDWFSRIHPEDLHRVKIALQLHHQNLTKSNFKISYRMRHQDGSYRWVLCRGYSLRDTKGRIYRMAGSQTDITRRKQVEEKLKHDALHDNLTGLPNRTLLTERLKDALNHNAQDKSRTFALMFIDLDRFKFINDSLGHDVGDQLLVSVAAKLTNSLRASDTIAHLSNQNIVSRFGGDEFAILLDNIRNLNEAIDIAERVQSSLSKPFVLNGHEITTSASIGIALNSKDFNDPEALLQAADTAMYRAKVLGKAQYAVFETKMRAEVDSRLQLESDLRNAIERQELLLHYQPIISLSSGKITGFEALLRWQSPKHGLVSPGEFIPIAEEAGLIIPIGTWVLTQACQQLAIWHAEFPEKHLTIGVNVSANQLAQTNFVQQVSNILSKAGLDGNHLKLEITEGVLMNRDKATVKAFQDLRDLGVNLQIDDFGTGYSSLSYIQCFPIDTLKIDRSFIANMSNNKGSNEITRTITNLGHNLGLTVVAEGIETSEQQQLLGAMGCDFGQGYLFSKPLDRQDIEQFMLTFRTLVLESNQSTTTFSGSGSLIHCF